VKSVPVAGVENLGRNDFGGPLLDAPEGGASRRRHADDPRPSQSGRYEDVRFSLGTLGFEYVIRFRANIHVTVAGGETAHDAAWVGKGGRTRKLREAEATAKRHNMAHAVCVRAKGMKEAWFWAGISR
jgi:hypothetical protein